MVIWCGFAQVKRNRCIKEKGAKLEGYKKPRAL
jgi:hypothetical protein